MPATPDPDAAPLLYLPGARWQLALRRGWKPATVLLSVGGLCLAFGASYALPENPAPGLLSGQALRIMAIFIAALLLWTTEAAPLIATALGTFVALSIAAIDPVHGAMLWNVQQVGAWFGDRVVFFLLGVFVIAGCLIDGHVIDHLALRLLHACGSSPRRLRQGVFWAAFFSSWFLVEHAVAAMLFPILIRIRDALGQPRGRSTYVAGLFHALAWGCTIGGIATYLGGARIALAMGILEKHGGQVPGFFELLLYSLPIAIPFGLFAAWMLERIFPIDVASVEPACRALQERRRELGRFGPQQVLLSAILILTGIAWGVLGAKWIAPVALGSGAMMIACGLARWQAVERQIPWELLLMEAAALALCAALEHTGAAAWSAHHALSVLSAHAVISIAAIALFTILLTELFSNPAVVTLLVPVLAVAAPSLGLSPLHAALAVALPCGLSFMLPLGSPPLAIAFSSGEYRLRRVIGWGALMDLLAVPIVVLAFLLVWTSF